MSIWNITNMSIRNIIDMNIMKITNTNIRNNSSHIIIICNNMRNVDAFGHLLLLSKQFKTHDDIKCCSQYLKQLTICERCYVVYSMPKLYRIILCKMKKVVHPCTEYYYAPKIPSEQFIGQLQLSAEKIKMSLMYALTGNNMFSVDGLPEGSRFLSMKQLQPGSRNWAIPGIRLFCCPWADKGLTDVCEIEYIN